MYIEKYPKLRIFYWNPKSLKIKRLFSNFKSSMIYDKLLKES
jgi:hypothetical protein